MTHTSILRSLSFAVIGSLWQRVAHSIRVSLRLGFLGVPCGLRLFCSSVDFVSLTVPRPSIPASLPLAVIGSLWQRIALSIQASLTLAFIGAISFAGDSMSPHGSIAPDWCQKSAGLSRSFAGIYQRLFWPQNSHFFDHARMRKQVDVVVPTNNMQMHRFADRFKTSLWRNKSEISSSQP